MSRPWSPGSCHEIYPLLNTLLQLHSSDQSFSYTPAWISCTNLLFFPDSSWKAQSPSACSLCCPLAAPLILWRGNQASTSSSRCAKGCTEPAQSVAPYASKSQHFYILTEAPEATRESAACPSFLVSGESGMSGRQKGKGWVCRKITSISEQGQ